MAASDLDLNIYQSSLQNIGKKLKVFVDNINDILVDLEDNDPRIDGLEARKVELPKEVRKNKNEIKRKLKEIKESQPDKEKEEAQVERNIKLKLKMESLNSKITDLMTDLTAAKKAKLLCDNEVRHTLSNLSRWELSLKEIKH